MKFRSLQQRLLAVVLASAIPVFIVHLAVQIFSDMRTASIRANSNAQDIAAAAIPLLQNTLVIGDLATAQKTLDNIMRQGQFQHLKLLDPGGLNLLLEGQPGSRVHAGRAPDWFVSFLDFHFEPQVFPISVGGVSYGRLLVEPSSVLLVAEIWQRMWTAVVLWLATLVFVLALLRVTLRRGLQPLDDLAATAYRFGSGDLNCRVADCDVPELAATAQAFNRMAENLSEAQDRLEMRVRERTAALSASEARTSAILRNLLDGVLQIDQQGMIRSANAAVCNLFGYQEEALLGRNIVTLMPELGSLPSGVSPVSHLIERQQNLQGKRHEVVGWRKDGSAFSLDISANELTYDNSSTCICVLRDISQQKAAEAVYEMARADAEQLAQAKSEFLANMSHEIRTPLNAILGLAEVGMRKSRGRQIAQTLEKILHSGALLLRLINDILDFSKIDADKLQLEAVPFDLGEVIDRAVDLNAHSAYAKGLKFVVTEAADLPRRCLGDPVRISQVLVNLLANAIKFTEVGSVSLDVSYQEGALRFRIGDSGIGMSAEVMARLFEPFAQADSSITRRFGGSGLGLVISRRLVALMGGELRIDSRPGVGTVIEVIVTLPEIESPARIVSGPPIRLLGLAVDEALPLSRALAEHGIVVSLTTSETTLNQPADGLLVVDAPFIAAHAEAALALLQQGQSLAIVYTPGIGQTLADDLAVYSRHLDRPLRWRHLTEAHCDSLGDCNSTKALNVAPRLVGVRILAAEDDAANRLVLREILQLEGASLVVEDNGVAACERLITDGLQAFDIVVTDIQMPLLDGYALACRIRALAPDLPVIGLSAHAMPEERERCLAAGMLDLVTKPVAIDVLVAVIRQHLVSCKGEVSAVLPPPEPGLTARVATAVGPAVVDWVALEARFNGKSDFVDQLAATVLASHAQTPSELLAVAARGDFSEMAALSHKIRGVGVNLMASSLHEQARLAEEAAYGQRPDAQVLLEKLAATLNDVLATLSARLPGGIPAVH